VREQKRRGQSAIGRDDEDAFGWLQVRPLVSPAKRQT
jgi:hypothetical protein